MPEYVGIRMLKARAGEIVRNVQRGMRYVVSIRGRPVALIIPVEPVPESEKQDAWESLYRAGSLLEWKTSQTTEELLDEVRG
ncbi:type II toxin-antitoxin system prevent-host-death family antitoxin [Anaerolinea sp.]|uniref:type II toxin-antitoxin system Phd/YefM family antitoxin n=1 Tax=Anaerolinea sp. TaxID=1872519 RepID=UPI002ACE92FD|nr:type II toxin-antitoxin system prevent-host-death family antitoxin [Anaerolinea sp.]